MGEKTHLSVRDGSAVLGKAEQIMASLKEAGHNSCVGLRLRPGNTGPEQHGRGEPHSTGFREVLDRAPHLHRGGGQNQVFRVNSAAPHSYLSCVLATLGVEPRT